ncbi:MAG: BTAD domain-containing putative transcriptional regulator [Thermodesulfobacteriota bacterium]
MTLSRFTTREVFDYFTSEIFAKADKETQAFLLSTSVLSIFSATMAQKLTGRDNAEQILSRIRQNHWFTENYPDKETRYQYHPLFREYLLHQAEESYSREHMKKIKEKAARLMEKDGLAEQAIKLFLESGNLHEAVNLIFNQAQKLTIQGRFQTLLQWLRRLPDNYISSNPQILYWIGTCRYRIDPYEGRDLFEKSFVLFEEKNEISGVCLALSGVLDSTTYGFNTLKLLDQWIPKLASLSQKYDKLPSSEIKGQLAASALFALTLRKPEHTEFKTWEKRGIKLLQVQAPEYIKLRIIMTLITHRTMTGELREADYFITQYRILTRSPNIPPYALISLSLLESCYYFAAGNLEQCRQAVNNVLSLAEETGVHVLSPLALGHSAAGELSAGNLDNADRQLNRMIQYSNSGNWIIEYYHTLSIWKALLEEDYPKALLHAELAAQYVEKAGVTLSAPICLLGVALGRKKAGEHDQSQKAFDQALSICSRIGTWQVTFACYLARAEFALKAGNISAAQKTLQKALSIGREKQYFNTWFWRPQIIVKLCYLALESDIEVNYVQKLIRERELTPESPPLEIENWPWPIRIYTLGRFALIKDGSPLSFTKKARGKPLEMLKTIIALGGRDVNENEVLDLLWPEADGDAAHGAFKTNLHRLRRLLGYHEALHSSEGKITLDPRYCWVDAWVFERMLSQADTAWQSAAKEQDMQKAADLAQKALKYYKGPLFQSEEGMAISHREYLHHRFIQAMELLGNYRQERKELEKAIALYEKGLKIDELVEPFYRGLMVCNHRLGRMAKAWNAYNRCKKVLGKNLITSPSAKTEALKNSLLNQ